MSKQSWDFTLLDTGFFRSGQPFHSGEGGHSKITSDFPPSIATLQGAIRTALASASGWKPGQSLPSALGDTTNLGQLFLHGPYLVWDERTLFPIPLNLFIKKNPRASSINDYEIETVFLEPGEKLTCDLGEAIKLPRKKTKLDGARAPKNLYITRSGYSTIAEGKGPAKDEIYFQEQLWHEETRIGLKLNPENRTAEEGNLYRIGHIRPESRLQIRVVVKGLPSHWPEVKQRIIPLGGEGRLAAVDIKPLGSEGYQNMLPPCPKLETAADGQIRYTVSLITPTTSSEGQLSRLIRKGPVNAPGKCICACVGKAQPRGGWDLKRREPRPLKPYLPSGSTWYFEADAAEKDNITVLHGNQIGDEETPAYGYGQILIGKWEVD